MGKKKRRKKHKSVSGRRTSSDEEERVLLFFVWPSAPAPHTQSVFERQVDDDDDDFGTRHEPYTSPPPPPPPLLSVCAQFSFRLKTGFYFKLGWKLRFVFCSSSSRAAVACELEGCIGCRLRNPSFGCCSIARKYENTFQSVFSFFNLLSSSSSFQLELELGERKFSLCVCVCVCPFLIFSFFVVVVACYFRF